MIYAVKARYREARAGEFYLRLTDGTIFNQKPDGKELVASMGRARITEPGVIQWTEKCFCDPPLKHERETVYDRFFIDMETVPVEEYKEFEGEPFMDFLAEKAGDRD
jgi:hypothetical protein